MPLPSISFPYISTTREVKKLFSSMSSNQFPVKKNKDNLHASARTVRINKVQSSVNIDAKQLTKSMSSALKPFPKLDPEFYTEDKTNYFWQKEMTRIKSEKTFLEKKSSYNSSRTRTEGNNRIFYNVSKVFTLVDCFRGET